MKMSDVFELPINEKRIELYGYDTVEPTSYQVAETAAAHAINCHDELVGALENLLHESKAIYSQRQELGDAETAAELALKHARGEA